MRLFTDKELEVIVPPLMFVMVLIISADLPFGGVMRPLASIVLVGIWLYMMGMLIRAVINR